LEKDKITAIKS